jgi:hypothetical protein
MAPWAFRQSVTMTRFYTTSWDLTRVSPSWILNGLKDKAPAQYGPLDRPYLIAVSPHTGLAHAPTLVKKSLVLPRPPMKT